MEPVVHFARTDMVRFIGHVPLEAVSRLEKGMIVDLTPVIEGYDDPIEKKRFRGKLVFIGPELSTSRTRAEVQVQANVMNNQAKELRVGLPAELTVYLDAAQAPPAPDDMIPMRDKEPRPQLGLNRPALPGPETPVQARADQ
jgi:hypothetical protein